MFMRSNYWCNVVVRYTYRYKEHETRFAYSLVLLLPVNESQDDCCEPL